MSHNFCMKKPTPHDLCVMEIFNQVSGRDMPDVTTAIPVAILKAALSEQTPEDARAQAFDSLLVWVEGYLNADLLEEVQAGYEKSIAEGAHVRLRDEDAEAAYFHENHMEPIKKDARWIRADPQKCRSIIKQHFPAFKL